MRRTGALLGPVERLGKAGGAALLALAAGSAVWVFSELTENAPVGLMLSPFPALLLFLGLIALRAERAGALAPLSERELKGSLRFRKPPYYVCLDCPLVLKVEDCLGECPRCGSRSACLEVLRPEDVEVVRRALEG